MADVGVALECDDNQCNRIFSEEARCDNDSVHAALFGLPLKCSADREVYFPSNVNLHRLGDRVQYLRPKHGQPRS
jgi:hypothetical protein